MVVTEEDDAGSKERTLWVPNTARKDKPEQCEQQSCGQGHHQTDRVTSRDERANHIDVEADTYAQQDHAQQQQQRRELDEGTTDRELMGLPMIGRRRHDEGDRNSDEHNSEQMQRLMRLRHLAKFVIEHRDELKPE